MSLIEFPVPKRAKPRQTRYQRPADGFITLKVPAYFSLTRLAALFARCGYRIHNRPDGTLCVLPHDGSVDLDPAPQTPVTPVSRRGQAGNVNHDVRAAASIPSHSAAVHLPHHRFAARLRALRGREQQEPQA